MAERLKRGAKPAKELYPRIDHRLEPLCHVDGQGDTWTVTHGRPGWHVDGQGGTWTAG